MDQGRAPLPGADRSAAAAALTRSVLLGRAAVTAIAAGVGLFVEADPGRLVAVLALVVVSAALAVAALIRSPGVLRRTPAVLVVDTALLAAVFALDAGATSCLFAAGAAALAGVLLGRRAWPLWALHAAVSLVAASRIPRADEVSAVAFALVTVAAGLVAASITAATIRHVDLLVEIVATAQRSAAASERAGLARELHDSVARTLRGVSFALPAALRRGPDLADHLADTVTEDAEAAAREARELIEGLRLGDPEEPFDQSVDRMCREWAESSRTRVRVSADPVEPSLATRYELSRILHEALRNVEQHADARRVDIWLRRAGDGVRLVVRDDGNGFSVPPDLTVLRSGGHFGVLGMAERAETIGGDFIVRSAPSDGTLVEVLAPLTPLAQDAVGP